ncbi:MAG: hypothetical protein ACI9O0_000983 [Paracoccaceae bacterium]
MADALCYAQLSLSNYVKKWVNESALKHSCFQSDFSQIQQPHSRYFNLIDGFNVSIHSDVLLYIFIMMMKNIKLPKVILSDIRGLGARCFRD